jgi:hypothetical protein
MPSPRYTVRLPQALDARVPARIRTTGTPFAVLMREALTAYLADTPPTAADRPPTAPLTPALTGADRDGGTSLTGADTTTLGYDPAKFVLGRLCPKGHAFGTTGMTLRRRHNQSCVTCATEQQRERLKTQREGRG